MRLLIIKRTTVTVTLILALSTFTFGQAKQIVGKYMVEKRTIVQTNQHIQTQSPYYYREVIFMEQLLLVGNTHYKLYKVDKPIDAAPVSNGTQQQQQVNRDLDDLFISGFPESEMKYCIFEGVIDDKAKVIYQAKLIRVLSELEVSELLNKQNK